MRKYALMTLMVVLVGAILLAGCQSDAWAEFAPEGEEFSVLMPGKPKAETETREGVTGTLYVQQHKQTNSAYIAGYFDYPQGSEYRLLEQATASYLVGEHDQLDVQAIELDGYPGRQVTHKIFGGPTIQARIYLVGSRLYTVTATTAAGEIQPEEVAEFLDSFDLTDK